MLRPRPLDPAPEETARVARALFPESHPYLRLADELGDLFSDEFFAPLLRLVSRHRGTARDG